MKKTTLSRILIASAVALHFFAGSQYVNADWTMEFSDSDFTTSQDFNNATSFNFSLVFAGELAPGAYVNPELVSVNYDVFGILTEDTPSGFPQFGLVRSIVGQEFYDQGSSMDFAIAAGSDLSDGLQFDELAGGLSSLMTINFREVGTGRYHPPILTLSGDGTGLMQNSNNIGGINPGNGQKVDVDFGEEYVTGLTFTTSTFRLSNSVGIPEPTGAAAIGMILFGHIVRRRR